MGGRAHVPARSRCEDHVYCIYEFPGPEVQEKIQNKKIGVTYSSINGNGFGGYGETVMGTKGTLILEREQEVMLFTQARPRPPTSRSPKARTAAHARHDRKAAAARRPPSARRRSNRPVEPRLYRGDRALGLVHPQSRSERTSRSASPKVAMADAVIALTTNIAIRENRRIEFKPEWFDIDSDETPEGIKPDLSRSRLKAPLRRGRERVIPLACYVGSDVTHRGQPRQEHSLWKSGRSACSPASTPGWA